MSVALSKNWNSSRMKGTTMTKTNPSYEAVALQYLDKHPDYANPKPTENPVIQFICYDKKQNEYHLIAVTGSEFMPFPHKPDRADIELAMFELVKNNSFEQNARLIIDHLAIVLANETQAFIRLQHDAYES